jgi:tetratricopeptide (TPR) repeat protein
MLCVVASNAQGTKPNAKGYDAEDAYEHFKHNNFLLALKVYKVVLKSDPKNIDYNYKIALCYLNTNIDKKLAIPYLEFVTKQEKYNDEALFDLGRAYHYANRFDDAIKVFNKYKKDLTPKAAERVDREIEMCNNGKELVKFPVKVTFENLREVNSEFPDYYPFITNDESLLAFTSRRKGNVGASSLEVDGYYSSDIYLATVKAGTFQKPKNAGSLINGMYDEQCVGIAPDGSSMMVYIDNLSDLGNIYMSKADKDKEKFLRPVKMNESINEGFETAGSLSPDGNTLFFASDRSGGKGMTDIYMVKKLPNGNWAVPQAIKIINTKYREDFPFMASDGKSLFFSSEGHSSMGGFDLFKTIYNEETNTFSAPKNLGYPINDSQDNRTISFTKDLRTGYISALREGGMGDLDIYRITFDQSEPRYTVYSGKVQFADSLNKKNIDAIIRVTSAKTQKEIGTYSPVPSTGRYVMALVPGKYNMTITSPGCVPYSSSLDVLDLGNFQPEVIMNVPLSKK